MGREKTGKRYKSFDDLERRWLRIPAGQRRGVIALIEQLRTTISVTLTTEDVVLANAVNGSIVLTLPAVADNIGKVYQIKKIDNTGNIVTIDANGSETIDDEETYEIVIPYTCITIFSDGDDWWII